MYIWFPCILSQVDSLHRCPYQGHLRSRVPRLGQGRHHQERSRDLVRVNCLITGLIATPLRHFLRISLRESLGFWVFQTLPNALGCVGSGIRANLLTTVNSLLFRRVVLLLIFGQYGSENIVKRILMTKVSLLGSGPDENRSKTGYDPSCSRLTR